MLVEKEEASVRSCAGPQKDILCTWDRASFDDGARTEEARRINKVGGLDAVGSNQGGNVVMP